MNRMLKIVGCTMLASVMFFSCAKEDCPTCPVAELHHIPPRCPASLERGRGWPLGHPLPMNTQQQQRGRNG